MEVPESDSEDELPAGWEQRATRDGCVYYVNHLTKGTQWNHPRTGKKKFVSGDMPFGWEKKVDDSTGEVIFIDHENGRKTYTDPRLAFAVEEKLHQDDFRQRFDSSTTALQVLHGRDLSGKVAFVTGCNTGIGFETAYSLARHGCKVIMACRDMSNTQKAINEIRSKREQSGELCIPLALDLSSLENVKLCAESCSKLTKKIDILILNAGVFGISYLQTIDNYETTFQVNHLSHLYLTLLLEPLLVRNSRVIFVSSESHRFASLNKPIEDLCAEDLSPNYESFGSMTAYNNSKLYNILCAKVLSNMWLSKNIFVNSLHPGNMVSSNLSRNWWPYRLLFAFVRPFTKSLQQAASTSAYCATALELEGTTGLYFNNCFRCETSNLAGNEEFASKIFDLCMQMIVRQMGSNELQQYIKRK
ncbi:WW domain-containing oxidoreductase [Arctopsyche grandis]|uniref:WW domain-containing oxidoreductase n=1 Tax=Arctopsyche grandis TaxID=121162 RepID=UPI00406D6605